MLQEWSPKGTVAQKLSVVCLLLDSIEEKERTKECYIAFYIARESHPGRMA